MSDQCPALRRVEWGVGLLTTAIIVYFHILFLHHAGPLWRDEVNSVEFAALPSLSDLWSSLRFDSFPVFSTLVIRLWTRTPWGDTDFGLRVLGLFVGVCILAALWLNARLLGHSLPFFSLALLGFSPLVIRFGDSIRPYGLGIFFILLTFGFIGKVIVSPSPRYVLAAGMAALLSVQCLYQNAFLVMALCLAGIAATIGRGARKRSALVAGIGLIAALSLVPYLRIIQQVQDWAVLNQMPIDFARIWNVVLGALSSGAQLVSWIWLSLYVLAVGISLSIVIRESPLTESQRTLLLFAAIAMVTGVVGLLSFVKVAGLPSQPWYYLPLMALVAVALDAIFGVLVRKRQWRMCRLALTAFLVAVSFSLAWQGVHTRQTNVDLIAARLQSSATKHDFVLVHPWYFGVSFHRYFKGETPWMTMPPLEDIKIHRYDLLKAKLMSQNPIEPIVYRVTQTLKSGHRVWLVGNLPDVQIGELPPSLPLGPPNGPSGWFNEPYVRAWAGQAAYFIRSHAVDDESLAVPVKDPVNPYEDLSFEVIRGWR